MQLVEHTIFKPEVLWEGAEGQPKRMKVRGVFQKIDECNRNKRRYPRSVWDTNLSPTSNFGKALAEKRVLGRLEHPVEGEDGKVKENKLKEASHLVTKVWIEGTDVIGETLILNTPDGKILQELFSVGVPVGISSRGAGEVAEQGDEEIVQDGYMLETFDFVYDPSVASARPTPIRESKESLTKGNNVDIVASAKILGSAKEKLAGLSQQVAATRSIRECVALNESCRVLATELTPLCTQQDFSKDSSELLGRVDEIQRTISEKLQTLAEKNGGDAVGEGEKITSKGNTPGLGDLQKDAKLPGVPVKVRYIKQPVFNRGRDPDKSITGHPVMAVEGSQLGRGLGNRQFEGYRAMRRNRFERSRFTESRPSGFRQYLEAKRKSREVEAEDKGRPLARTGEHAARRSTRSLGRQSAKPDYKRTVVGNTPPVPADMSARREESRRRFQVRFGRSLGEGRATLASRFSRPVRESRFGRSTIGGSTGSLRRIESLTRQLKYRDAKYANALKIIEALSKNLERKQIVSLVDSAIKVNPKLEKIRSKLLKLESYRRVKGIVSKYVAITEGRKDERAGRPASAGFSSTGVTTQLPVRTAIVENTKPKSEVSGLASLVG